MSEEFVAEALEALRRADEGVEAGPEAEIRALLAFRRYRRRRASLRIGLLAASAAAVVLLTVVFRPVAEVPEAPRAAIAAMPSQTAAIPSQPAPVASPVSKSGARARPREITTDFFPLMESQPPLEQAMLVRVTVPAATMRAVGLSVGDQYLSDPVQADVLVGQDDLARAIRFVSYRK